MKYLYQVFEFERRINAISDFVVEYDDFDRINVAHVTNDYFVRIFKLDEAGNISNIISGELNSEDDLDMWRLKLEREAVWLNNGDENLNTTESNTPIKPKHYESFIDEYQWLDAMSRIPRYKDPELFKSAVELQVRKYLDRNGRKDEELQELMKGLFYYIYLVKYIKNGNKPILAKEVHSIMEMLK